MESVSNYLITVIAGAVICALIICIIGKNNHYYGIIKLLLGLFLAITVISPWSKLNFDNISSHFSEFRADASSTVLNGTTMANNAMGELIKQNVEAYILDKANSLGADVDIEITVSNDNPPVPISVVIRGTVAPYTKVRLQQMLENDFEITKENQLWT